MSTAPRSLKQKAARQMREYAIISLYLFVVFALLIAHKAVILGFHMKYAVHGVALINALALAKVVLIAQDLHLADQFRDTPLIYPTLLKSLAFAVLLACFKIVEDGILGRLHGKTLHGSLADLGDGSWLGILVLTALLFVMLIPFFGFTELRRVFGEDCLIGVFFRPRHLWNVPPTAPRT